MKDLMVKNLKNGEWKFSFKNNIYTGVLKKALVKDIIKKQQLEKSVCYFDQENKIVMFQIKK